MKTLPFAVGLLAILAACATKPKPSKKPVAQPPVAQPSPAAQGPLSLVTTVEVRRGAGHPLDKRRVSITSPKQVKAFIEAVRLPRTGPKRGLPRRPADAWVTLKDSGGKRLGAFYLFSGSTSFVLLAGKGAWPLTPSEATRIQGLITRTQ